MTNSRLVTKSNECDVSGPALIAWVSYARSQGIAGTFEVRDWDENSNLLMLEDKNGNRKTFGISTDESGDDTIISIALTAIVLSVLSLIGVLLC
jgi:hypothetical protein